MDRLNKDEVIRTIKGYERAASFIREERFRKLRSLSAEESLAIFLDLWRAWGETINKTRSKDVEQLKLKRLVERRKRIDKLARWKQVHDRSA